MRTQVEEVFHHVVDLSDEGRERYYIEHSIDNGTRREVEALVGFDAGSSQPLRQDIRSAAEEAMERFEPEGMLCGSYRLGRCLGRGGMGSVYLADRVDGEVAQQAAVKVLRASADDQELRQRFLAERQILAGLSHPHIARLLDAGHREDGLPYLVMEHVAGRPIDQYCAGMSVTQKVALFVKVCSAVAYLHRNLVVHRDLKPANILVTEEGDPKLLDFGIAKMLDLAADSGATGVRMLTPDYASPEQLTGARVTTASDIYSLGAVLYHLLTGRTPHHFRRGPAGEIEWESCIDTITPPGKLAPELKGDLDVILMRALRRDPQDRYSTIEQFSEDLESYLESRPIRARKADLLYRMRKFLRRYWLPAGAAAVALASLATALVIMQRERDISVRRFNEVRQLANQLFTIEKDVRTLAGSTQTRERIVKVAMQYLERLGKEAGNDLGLRAEIASAYVEVANIQGGFRAMNLGHPNEARATLKRAEDIYRGLYKIKPNDAGLLHDYVGAMDLRLRIEYGQLNQEPMVQALEALQKLVPRYEAVAAAKTDEWDFLGGIYSSMSLASARLARRTEALHLAERAVDLQRKAAAGKRSTRTMGNLASAISYYARTQRAVADLDGALHSNRESLEIAKQTAEDQPTDVQAQLNLATKYATMASIHDTMSDVSEGKLAEAIPWYERALEIDRKLFETDPHENQIRYNTVTTAMQFANVIRGQDPKRAAALYDEAITMCRDMPPAASRDMLLGILLAESTFALRRTGREAEARSRLAEAAPIAEATSKMSPDSAGLPAEAVARAEADWAMALGRPADAAAIHRRWLEQLRYGAASAQNDLHSGIIFAIHWEKLGRAYEKSGQLAQAAEAEGKRRELMEFWKKKLPNSARIAWSW